MYPLNQKKIIRDAPFDILGGGGGRIKKKYSLLPQKSEKKVCWKCGQKKKVCCRNLWKICWLEKTPNGNVHNRESIWQNNSSTKHKKKIVGLWSPKKSLFSTGGEKKSLQATKTLGPPPPPDIKWCVPYYYSHSVTTEISTYRPRRYIWTFLYTIYICFIIDLYKPTHVCVHLYIWLLFGIFWISTWYSLIIIPC